MIRQQLQLAELVNEPYVAQATSLLLLPPLHRQPQLEVLLKALSKFPPEGLVVPAQLFAKCCKYFSPVILVGCIDDCIGQQLDVGYGDKVERLGGLHKSCHIHQRDLVHDDLQGLLDLLSLPRGNLLRMVPSVLV